LDTKVLFPRPFAGVGFEDAVTAAEVDLARRKDDVELQELANYFDTEGAKCPTVVLMRRGDILRPDGPSSSERKAGKELTSKKENFESWGYGTLKADVTFQNKSPWAIDIWWVPQTLGSRPVLQVQLLPERPIPQSGAIPVDNGNSSIKINTYLSHVFSCRPSFVETYHHSQLGGMYSQRGGEVELTNASSLLWYTTRLQDDGITIPIVPACLDLYSDCARWMKEGFCEPIKQTHSTRLYPGQRNFTREHCPVSCGDADGCANMLASFSAAKFPAHLSDRKRKDEL